MIRLVLAVVAMVLVFAATAFAHHPAPETQVPTKSGKLVPVYNNLHDKASKNPRVYAGRHLVKHGRAKDGKQAKWSNVHKHAVRLYTELRPGPQKEHARRARIKAQRNAYRAPADWVAARAGLRYCESYGSGGYSANTGNGFYGAYQFDLQTWYGVGGTGLPSNASPAEQDYRAWLLWQRRGSQPWPTCGTR